LTRWINDPEVTQFLHSYLPMSEQEELEWVNGLAKKKSEEMIFSIIVEGKLIGIMGLHRINVKDRTATTGSIIGEKEYWGKGYGTEAKMLLLHYAFNTLNLRKICSAAIAFNERSLRFNRKCGYEIEGTLREQFWRNGQYHDLVQIAVFRDKWLPLWEKFREDRGISAL
jgi:RimJ/RimL family protein N-acetyltransferase